MPKISSKLPGLIKVSVMIWELADSTEKSAPFSTMDKPCRQNLNREMLELNLSYTSNEPNKY